MISNIQKLKNFGIFKNYNNKATQNFGRYNLVYGWNGTGKSTLSGLFSSLEKRTTNPSFTGSEFTITTDAGSTVTEKNLATSNLNIQVFNQKFVQDNIDWNSSDKSILLVAKEKIDEIKKLEELKKQVKEKDAKYTIENTSLGRLVTDQAKFMTDSARHVKTGLQSIDTSDSYYLNYDKRKLEGFIGRNKEKIDDPTSILQKDKIVELTNSAKSAQLPAIRFVKTVLDNEYYKQASTRLRDLLKTTAVSKTLERLSQNSDIQKWVQDGIEIHHRHNSSCCEFCGNQVSEQRAKEIESHFSEEFKNFQSRLAKAHEWLINQSITQPILPSPETLYKEFSTALNAAAQRNSAAVNEINEQIKKWQIALDKKIENPFDVEINIEEIAATSIDAFNSTLTEVQNITEQHDNKTDNFGKETKKSKEALELHYAASEIKAFGFESKAKTIETKTAELNALDETIKKAKQEIKTIEASLSNETIGADKFNDSLHKFIGRSELCLKFNSARKGYEIIRNNVGTHDGNLSEGEKTAIAFIYFITKLEENNNRIQDTIVVVDDPVSSFDSNHLFHAYSFLKTRCIDAKQLFVLTHNFTYYKLVRDWFNGTNKNRSKKTPAKPPVAFFFRIDTTAALPRESLLMNADSSLTDYNSEYHYIFSKLYLYKERKTLDRDEAFLTANLSRKLVESFFTFKFPKGRSDVNALLESGLKNCTVTTAETKEKIYRFINKYSHSDVIEINEESAENLAGESHSVIEDIFKWIEEIDLVHYNEMVEVVAPPKPAVV